MNKPAGNTALSPRLDEAELQKVLWMNDTDINRTAAAMKAMAHPLRLKILCELGKSEQSVQELTRRAYQTSQSNVSQHLSQLLERGVLSNRKVGNKVLYRVRDSRILALVGVMKGLFCETRYNY